MKICISSTGDNVDSSVDPRFGRCPFFLIYDDSTENYEFISNSSRNAMGGAGIQAAQEVISKGVEAVITGNIGPNSYRVFESAKIKIYTGVSGPIKEAIAKYKANQLTSTSGPSVQSHYGMGKE
ncbi:MAG TPA: dinitrogenase iron-molybdenum cofactor biosynthesis protein [Actinobacteria bacterium]|jgi:predicted Fe-Mo cluster-binding NifX family protein|nr:dinitrogenase iron-molybdenum cofactor biosynthesis protein [Actinomycetota bacterium]